MIEFCIREQPSGIGLVGIFETFWLLSPVAGGGGDVASVRISTAHINTHNNRQLIRWY